MLVLSMPAVYTLELTPACSNGCPGCFNTYAAARRKEPLPAAKWEALMAEIGPHAARIRLTGGEPTLHPEFERILRSAGAFGAPVTVFTNARWQHPERTLAALKANANLAGLLISLHGACAGTHEAFTRVRGSFDETLRNARQAAARGITVAFSTVITRRSLAELEAIADLAETLGAEYVAFNRNLGPQPGHDGLNRADLLAAVRRIETMIGQGKRVTYGACIPQCLRTNHSDGCMAGVTQLTIDPWGEARPCIYARSSVGNVFTTPIAALWHGPALQNWRAMEADECSDCAAYPVCHGGCRAARERYAAEDPLHGKARRRYTVTRTIRAIPEQGRPRHDLRIREEQFGYCLIGRGQVWPVRHEALEILSACDGSRTIAALREEFRPPHIELLQELWNAGLIDLTEL